MNSTPISASEWRLLTDAELERQFKAEARKPQHGLTVRINGETVSSPLFGANLTAHDWSGK